MRRSVAVAISGWGTAAAIGLVALAAGAVGLRFNLTASAPWGVWRIQAVDPALIVRGTLVAACPPDLPLVALMRRRGYLSLGDCPTGVAPLLKPVGAVTGDRIRIRGGQPVEVNGVPLVNTRAEPGMPAWVVDTTVAPGEVWLFSSYSAGSFDSRYFGPVPVANLRGLAVPVAVVGNRTEMLQEEPKS